MDGADTRRRRPTDYSYAPAAGGQRPRRWPRAVTAGDAVRRPGAAPPTAAVATPAPTPAAVVRPAATPAAVIKPTPAVAATCRRPLGSAATVKGFAVQVGLVQGPTRAPRSW